MPSMGNRKACTCMRHLNVFVIFSMLETEE